MKHILKIQIIFLTFLFLLFLSVFSLADGLAISRYSDMASIRFVSENAQYAAINYEDGKERFLLAVELQGAPDNSSLVWVVPVPSQPENISLNLLKEFPRFSGTNQSQKAKDQIASLPFTSTYTQIYPLLIFGSVIFSQTIGMVGEVEVHAEVEKDGIVSQLITAKTAQDIYDYLQDKNISLEQGAIPVLEKYIGKDYSFIVTWVEKPEAVGRNKSYAIFAEFPSEKIYFPLEPTSVYGERSVPVILYVLGYVEPHAYSEIAQYLSVNYFSGRVSAKNDWLLDFASNAAYNGYEYVTETGYTRILIGGDERFRATGFISRNESDQGMPSSNFVADLWMEKKDLPAIYSISQKFLEYYFVFLFLWIAVLSVIIGFISGKILFNKGKRFAVVGLANCLTIIGLFVVADIATKKDNLPIGKFILLFSVLFVVVNIAISAVLYLLPF